MNIKLKRKPILLIDMDGVIANYYDYFSQIWTIKYPDRPLLKPEELTSMYFEECYHPDHMEDIRKITTDIGFFESLPVMHGAAEALNKIFDEGKFDVFLCSTPDTHSVDHCCPSEKMRWVHMVLGERWLKRVILTHDKTLVHGDFLIDDKPEIKGVNKDPSWEHVVYTHKYNDHLNGHRLDGWAHWPELEEKLLTHYHSE